MVQPFALAAVDGRLRWLGALRKGHLVLFAAACGALLAGLGIAFGPGAFGTGYEQARSLVQAMRWSGTNSAPSVRRQPASYLAGIRYPWRPVLARARGRRGPRQRHRRADAGCAGEGDRAARHVRLPHRRHPGATDLGGDIDGTHQQRRHVAADPATVLVARGASALVCRMPVY